jgi:hypothetical protein
MIDLPRLAQPRRCPEKPKKALLKRLIFVLVKVSSPTLTSLLLVSPLIPSPFGCADALNSNSSRRWGKNGYEVAHGSQPAPLISQAAGGRNPDRSNSESDASSEAKTTRSNDDEGASGTSGGRSEPRTRMLQAEIGASGHYEDPQENMPSGTQPPSQPPPPLYGQVGSPGQFQQAPLYGQAGMGAPYQPLYGQAGMGGPYQPLYGQAMQAPPLYGQAEQPGFGYPQAPLQAGAFARPAPTYQSSISHGQMTIGVLGAEFGMLNNQIRQILPGSDLLKYGITPGDIIEAADGQQLRGKAMQAYIRGTPGTYVQLTILHRGQLLTIPVQRKDTREFSSYDSYFRKWAAKEKFW